MSDNDKVEQLTQAQKAELDGILNTLKNRVSADPEHTNSPAELAQSLTDEALQPALPASYSEPMSHYDIKQTIDNISFRNDDLDAEQPPDWVNHSNPNDFYIQQDPVEQPGAYSDHGNYASNNNQSAADLDGETDAETDAEIDTEADDETDEQEPLEEGAESADFSAEPLQQQQFADNFELGQFSADTSYSTPEPPQYRFSPVDPDLPMAAVHGTGAGAGAGIGQAAQMRVPLFGSLSGFINQLVNRKEDLTSTPDFANVYANNIKAEIKSHQQSCQHNEELLSALVKCSSPEHYHADTESSLSTLIDELNNSNHQVEQSAKRLNRLVSNMLAQTEMLNRVNEQHTDQVNGFAEQLENNQQDNPSEAIKALLAGLVENIKTFINNLTGRVNEQQPLNSTDATMEPA